MLGALCHLIELLEKEGYRVEEAYVFGSYVRGDWIETSDVDLVIVSPSFRGTRFIDRLELVYRLEWRARLKPWIEVIPLTPEEFEERLRSSAVLKDASRYWIPLRCREEARAERARI
ncbi:MAG: nucleotidyltransferase domain-containing protein [Desulfurococcales archaeon]|nr:nucleotidyltransferase domain-containing protein [Desulfurococcales archaeon]